MDAHASMHAADTQAETAKHAAKAKPAPKA